jgi:hypothetical protein
MSDADSAEVATTLTPCPFGGPHLVAKRIRPLRPVRRQPHQDESKAGRFGARSHIDFAELTTGIFVLVATLLPASPMFEHANGIVATTLIFGFGMAWLAMLAYVASFAATRGTRLVLLGVGAAVVIAAGTFHAIQLERAALILPGLWIVAMRLRPPPGVIPFDASHCRCAAFEAMTAWLTLIAVFVLYVLVHALSGGTGPAEMRQDGRFAIAWGGFYGALALLMPMARRVALKWRVDPTMQRGGSKRKFPR